MATKTGTFEKGADGYYSAVFEVEGTFNIHMEKNFAGPVRIDPKTSGEDFAKGMSSDEFSKDKVLYIMDETFDVGFPATIRIVCLTKGGDEKPTYIITE